MSSQDAIGIIESYLSYHKRREEELSQLGIREEGLIQKRFFDQARQHGIVRSVLKALLKETKELEETLRRM